MKILTPLVEAEFQILPTPGNHDYGRWGMNYNQAAARRFQKYIHEELLGDDHENKPIDEIYPKTRQVNGIVFIGLDSVYTNLVEEGITFATGEIGKKQRNALAKILLENPEQQKVVHFHHHPFMRNFTLEMEDATKVMGILAGRTTVLCFGHKHVSDLWEDHHDIDWILASGKTTEKNRRGRFQYREVGINGSTISVGKVLVD